MGGSKKQTVGYEYHLGTHQILFHGPADGMSRYTVDGRLAWSGWSTGGQIYVNAPTLFGGEGREGGISGYMDIEMGLPDQGRNSYLQGKLGTDIPAFRGVVGIVQRQMYLGNNPYLKKNGFRFQRIHLRSGGVEQWYDEKAAIPVALDSPPLRTEYINLDGNSANTSSINGHTISGLSPSDVVVFTKPPNLPWLAWSPWDADDSVNPVPPPVPGHTWGNSFRVSRAGASTIQFNTSLYETAQEAYDAAEGFFPVQVTGSTSYTVWLYDDNTGDNRGGLSLMAQVFPTQHFDMNPSHIIRECLTDSEWGMGYAEEDIDDDSFMAAADTLWSEGMGISLMWDRQMAIEQFVQEIVKHINAALYVGRRGSTAGKFVLKLIRGDYNEETLPHFDESNIEKIEGFKRVQEGELTNSVSVNYWDALTGKTASTTAQDPALVQQQGAVINTTMQYPGFTHAAIANRVALRDLTTLSTPLASCTIYTGRDAIELNIGDVIAVSWEDYGLTRLPMRITAMSLGDGKSNKIKLTLTQDAFALPEQGVIVPPDVGWEDPNQEPAPLERQYAEEMPYYELVQSLGQSVTDNQLATLPDLGLVGTAAGRAQEGAINARFMTDDGTGYEDVGAIDFCATAALAAPVSQGDGGTETEVWEIESVTDANLITPGQWAKVGAEYVLIVSYNHPDLEVKRGVLDTIPHEHEEGAVIFFSDAYVQADPVEYVASDEVGVKLLPVTGMGTLPEDSAVEMPVALDSRAIRPYPPANVNIEGNYWTYMALDDFDVEFATRNRLQQTGGELLGFYDSGDVTLEAGVTFTIEVYDAADDTLLHTYSGGTGSPMTVELAHLSEELSRLEIFSVRDGYESWQRVTMMITRLLELLGSINGGLINETVTNDPLTLDPDTGNPVTFTLQSGTLPPGWTVGASTGVVGGVCTTGSTPGYYTFTIRATDDVTAIYAEATFTVAIGKVLLMMNYEGTNGATAFTDEAGHTLTTFGNAQLSNAQKPYGTTSLYLDGAGDYVSATHNDLLALNGSDYTIAGWVYLSTWSSNWLCFWSNFLQQSNARSLGYLDTSKKLRFQEQSASGGASLITGGDYTFPTGQWVYVETNRKGNEMRLFADGVLVGTTTGAAKTQYPNHFRAGAFDVASGTYAWYWPGYLKRVMVVAGVALHDANYTPPTAPSDFPVVP